MTRGRRTVTTWLRAAKLGGRYQSCYIAVAAAGERPDRIARRLLNEAVRPLLAGAARLTLALDDTPTKRHGPHVQGAGVHHNPTPGPAGSPNVYGRVFVVLGLLVTHRAWGTTALPLLSRLFVRKKDLPAIDPKHRPTSRTKLELAVELLRWAKPWLDLLKLPIWVVADGASAKKEVLKPAKAMGMIVVSRLRKDAALRSLPGPRPQGRRGPAPTYGADVIDLAKRGGQRRGWSSDTFELYGEKAVKRYETFQATWRPAGRRGDPGGTGGRADRLAGVLLQRHLGERGRHPGDGGRPLQPGDHLSRMQAGRGCRSAAGQVHLGEHWGVSHLPMDVHADRGVGLGPGGRGVGGPLELAVGQLVMPSEPRGQAAGMASRNAGRGDPCGSTPWGHQEGIQAAAVRLLSLAE
ncbi:IS701 family transposase [Paludisphaera mucosa]|uniref:Transposase n=1 Tax=Paludisphaera mucosa TaxID=3030827 RepID=A0ABT6FFQ7_9BACT|nr:transposase [Paludisphaera mucosa]MDG3006411.1 transposase [Paludisphaera mucosa]